MGTRRGAEARGRECKKHDESERVKAGRRRASAAEACLRSYVPPMSVPQDDGTTHQAVPRACSKFRLHSRNLLLAHPEKQVVQPWARRVLIRVDLKGEEAAEQRARERHTAVRTAVPARAVHTLGSPYNECT